MLVWMFYWFLTICCVKAAISGNGTGSGNSTTDSSTCYSDESCLYDHLMENYNSQVRPVTGPSGTVQVAIVVGLKTILTLDERNEVFHTVLSISADWNDRFLSWEYLRFTDINVILVNVKNLWLPDFAVTNSVEKFYQTTFLEDFRAYVRRNGGVTWLYGGIFKTTCSLDISKYPFDKQKCSIIIENWSYTESLVNLTHGEFRIGGYTGSSLWDITNHTVERTSFGTVVSYPRLTFTIYMKRKSRYYVLNLILPTVFVMFAALGVFLLPPGCGEKISLGITVLLAFSVFQIVITGSTPVNSEETPIISQGVISVMGLATLSVLTSMIAVYLHYKGPTKRVPKWIRHIAFQYLAKVFCSKDDVPSRDDSLAAVTPRGLIVEEETAEFMRLSPKLNYNSKEKNRETNQANNLEMTLTQNTLTDMLSEVRKITDTIKEQKHEEFIMDEWKLLAKIIDKILFVVALIILFAVLMLMIQ